MVDLAPKAVAKRMQDVDLLTELNEADKKKLRSLYKDALAKLSEGDVSKADAKRLALDIAAAEETEKKMKAEYESLLRNPDIKAADVKSIKQAQVKLNQALERLKQHKSEFAEELLETSRRDKRIKAIPKELKEAKEKLADVDNQLKEATKIKGPAGVAQRTLYAAWQLSLQQKIDKLEKERDAFAATVTHLPIRRTLAAQRVFYTAREVKKWRDLLAERRLRELDQQINEANALLKKAPEGLRAIAAENLKLAKDLKAIRKQSDAASQEMEEVKRVFERVRERRRRTEQMVSALGLTDLVGKILLADRAALPNVRPYLNKSRRRQEAMQRLKLNVFKLEEKRTKLDASLYDKNGQAELYIKTNQKYLDGLISDSTSTIYELVELDAAERKLVEEVQAFVLYIDEHVLWIASTSPLGRKADLIHISEAIGWLLDPNLWIGMARALRDDFTQFWFLYGVVCLVFCILLALSRRLSHSLLEIGERVVKSGYVRFWPTLQALLVTLLISIVFPIPMWLLGWRLGLMPGDMPLARALGGGLVLSARVFLLMLLIRHVCREKGLAGAHFGWTDTDLGKLRRYVRWLVLLIVPLSFVAGMMHSQPRPEYDNSVGRICFIASMVILALFAHRVLRPKTGLMYQMSVVRGAEWVTRLRYVWYVVGVGAPLALVVLAAIGYYYTAWQLMLRLEATLWLLFGFLLVGSLLLRWVLIARRWLGFYQSRKRSEQKQAATANAPPGNGAPSQQPAEPEVDLSKVNEQTRRLLLTVVIAGGLVSLWLIWVDVFPALNFLDQVQLWNKTVTVTTQTGTTLAAVERVEPVTLFDLLVATLIVLLSFVVIRNLAGLFQLLMLERLPIDASLRFTVITITRYIVVLIAVLLVSERVGLAWSSVQWLVAALMIGLGFGLQEIFANFVSGIILLVERPIRVGDLVTVGTTVGEVTKIQMRATTIRDLNKRELIVPNKQLVTDKLVNWSLTDSVFRVDLKIGIAYGSDTQVAREVLLQIAAEHPDILPKPTPKAIFKKFGDSALEFEFRICIPHMDYWPRVVTEVNQAIDKKFKEAGIVIAFPQRDIHIRTVRDDETAEDGVLRRLQESGQENR